MKRFLQCASIWADVIIIADQNSTDDTETIARSFSKVIYVKNPNDQYNEAQRQELLLHEARKFGSNNVLIALDADEILSANFVNSSEWAKISSQPIGTKIAFQWANLSPDFKYYWSNFPHFVIGVVDSGSEKQSQIIHSPRVPFDNTGVTVFFEDVKLLHFQYTDWDRMLLKQYWYQCFERIKHPEKSLLDIFELYNHYRFIDRLKLPVNQKWFDGYFQQGIDLLKTELRPETYYWTTSIKAYFEAYGPDYFSRLNIWNDGIITKYIGSFPPVEQKLRYQIYRWMLMQYGSLPAGKLKMRIRKLLNLL